MRVRDGDDGGFEDGGVCGELGFERYGGYVFAAWEGRGGISGGLVGKGEGGKKVGVYRL